MISTIAALNKARDGSAIPNMMINPSNLDYVAKIM